MAAKKGKSTIGGPLDVLLAYGEERAWSCAEMARAVRELRR